MLSGIIACIVLSVLDVAALLCTVAIDKREGANGWS